MRADGRFGGHIVQGHVDGVGKIRSFNRDGDNWKLQVEFPEDAARVKSLVIPPAWRDVWVCPWPNGHLQAVGTDDAGRRQYLYHPAWRTQRDAAKHVRVVELGRVLSRAREQVLVDLGTDGMSQDRACAVAVRLIDLGYFRIGNDVYAEENGSFGLTTLQRQHVRKQGSTMVFCFVGKSGVEHCITIDDPATVQALEAMRRRRGSADRKLLAWKEGRTWRELDSGHVNDYVRRTTGLEATAKDFRTWHATVLAAAHLAEEYADADAAGRTPMSERARKRAVTDTMRQVSTYLGNTPAVCRASYVDPRVVERFGEGRTIARALRGVERVDPPFDPRVQGRVERAVLKLLT